MVSRACPSFLLTVNSHYGEIREHIIRCVAEELLNLQTEVGNMRVVDAEVIMSRIRAAIQERRLASGLDVAEFDVLANGAGAHPTLEDLRRDLACLIVATRYNGVDMVLSDVRPSLVSGLIQRFRAALHEVILFYVNRLAAQQASVNRLTLRTLQTAFQLIEVQQARLEALEREGTIAADHTAEEI